MATRVENRCRINHTSTSEQRYAVEWVTFEKKKKNSKRIGTKSLPDHITGTDSCSKYIQSNKRFGKVARQIITVKNNVVVWCTIYYICVYYITSRVYLLETIKCTNMMALHPILTWMIYNPHLVIASRKL